MYMKLYGAHLLGLEGQVIEVEVDISTGLPSFDIVGLPGTALKESKERVRSAIKNSGFTFPLKRITVNLAPAHIKKEGSYFDVVIAMAILLADEQVQLTKDQKQKLQSCLFIGELALDGSTRYSHGIFPLILAAKKENYSTIFLPAENVLEAGQVKGIQLYPAAHLMEIIHFFSAKRWTPPKPLPRLPLSTQGEDQPEDLFEHVIGQDHAKRAFEVAACGFHHIMMIGPPGSGKTMLARRMVHILPDLTEEEALEVTKVRSVAGLLHDYKTLRRCKQRLFRSPHHTITAIGMMGGGTPIKPGEISIAHQGVLFLDEFLEFKRSVIEGLREPLEDRKITITRSNQSYTFPANLLLIIALNPCPCGYYGYESEKHSCTCTAAQIKRYQHKLSGPLYDRIDLHIEVPLLTYEALHQTNSNRQKDSVYTSEKMKKRVQEGISFRKWRSKLNKSNGLLTSAEIKKECRLTRSAEKLLQTAFEELHFSARGYHKILKIARTIADLNQQELIDEGALSEAIHYRSFERHRI